MHDPLVVSIGDGIADGRELLEQFAEPQTSLARVATEGSFPVKRLDRLLERLPLDQGHRVKRPVVILAQAVDGDDAGVLQPRGDRGLAQKPLACGSVESLRTDSFESHQPPQLLLASGEHLAQSAAGVVSLGPVNGHGPQEIGHFAVRGIAGARVPGSREIVGVRGVDHRIDPAQGVDPDPQFLDELRAIRAEFLGRHVSSLSTQLIPLDEQVEQPLFDGWTSP